MIGANATANADDFVDYVGKPDRELPDSEGFGINALYRLYQARSGWVFLACPMEPEWDLLCEALNRKDLLEDNRFINTSQRRLNDQDLISELSITFAKKHPGEWEQHLTSQNIACVKVEDSNMFNFFDSDPHVQLNEFTTEVSHKRFGSFWRYSPVLKFSRTPCKAGGGILRGEHTNPILNELGFSQDKIAAFKKEGVLDWEEARPLF